MIPVNLQREIQTITLTANSDDRKTGLMRINKRKKYLIASIALIFAIFLGVSAARHFLTPYANAENVNRPKKSSSVMVTGSGYKPSKAVKKINKEQQKYKPPRDKSKSWIKSAPKRSSIKKSINKTGAGHDEDNALKDGPDSNKNDPDRSHTGASTTDPDNTDEKIHSDKSPIISLSISDGDVIYGNTLNFSMSARTYDGYKIESSNFHVSLNDKRISGASDPFIGKYSSSIASGGNSVLKAGLNTITASVTDEDRNRAQIELRIIMDPSESAKIVGTVTVSMDCSKIGIKSPAGSSRIKITRGEKVSQVVVKYFKLHGIKIDTAGNTDNGFYLRRIHKRGIKNNVPSSVKDRIFGDPEYKFKNPDSLGEKDFGRYSGWKYTLNGREPSGMSSVTVNDGDEIEIYYTLSI